MYTAREVAWKLAAVVVAYTLWLAVVEEKQLVTQLQVPVRFENLDPGLSLVGERPSSVEVQVQAPEGVVQELRPIDIEVKVDLTAFREGKHIVQLLRSPTDSSAPSIVPRRLGVEVVNAFPRALGFQLEPKSSLSVPVRPQFVGQPVTGFGMTDSQISPVAVRLVGPQSALEGVAEVVTKEIDLDGRRASFEQEVWLDFASPDVVMSEPVAKVMVTITENVVERIFEAVPVAAVRGTYDAELSPRSATITIRGPERLLTALTDADLMAYVDVQGLEPQRDSYQLPVQVTFARQQFRDRLQVLAISNEQVSVRLLGDDDPKRKPKSERGS